jgi:hypothetical protein
MNSGTRLAEQPAEESAAASLLGAVVLALHVAADRVDVTDPLVGLVEPPRLSNPEGDPIAYRVTCR